MIKLVTDTELKIVSAGENAVVSTDAPFTIKNGASIFSVFPLLDVAAVDRIKLACLQNADHSERLDMCATFNGRTHYFTWMICAFTDHLGNAKGLQWVGIENAASRRQKEQAFFHQVVLENISDALITMDNAMRITAFSKTAEQIYGIDANTMMGRKFSQFFDISPVANTMEDVTIGLQNNGQWHGAFQVQKVKGDVLFMYSRIVAVKNDCGEQIGFVTINRDLTEHHLLQQQHRKESVIKTLLQEIMDQTGAMAWATDIDGYKHYMNATYRQALGVNSDSEKVHLSELFSGEELQKMLAENKQIIELNTQLDAIEEITMGNGEKARFRSIRFPVHTAEGVYAAGFALDITKELLREKELNHLKLRFEKAAKIIADVITDWDIENDILWRSDPESGMEVHPQKSTSMDMRYSRIHEDDLDGFQTSLQAALRSDADHWQHEYRYQSGSREGAYKILHENAVIMRDEKGKAKRMISVVQDVTEQRRLQRELKEKEAAVLHATIEGQEAERTELARELHDNVGQVLAMCKLFVDIAADSVQHEYLEKCREHLQQAISEIRNLSHRLSPETLNRKGLLAAITDMAESINQTGKLHVSLNLCEQVQHTLLPRNIQTTVYRIVQECVNNVLKHAQAKAASLALFLQQDLLHIEIKDNGKGFDPAQGAAGIGLKNIHSRIEMSGGTFSLKSAPGNGCTVFVQLPLAIGS